MWIDGALWYTVIELTPAREFALVFLLALFFRQNLPANALGWSSVLAQ